jgi:hypothetical protein
MSVGVVLERRKTASRWVDHMWEAHAVLPEPPEAEPGAVVGRNGEDVIVYGGPAALEVYPAETQHYLENLASGAPAIWVVLRPQAGDSTPEIVLATCDPSEGEGYSETGWDTVNRVPMPEPIQAALAAFVAEHHVDEPFVKRKRDRQDPEALAAGRRGPDRDRFLRTLRKKEDDHGPA